MTEPTTSERIGERIYLIRLALGHPPRRPMPLKEFGVLVGEWMGREKPFDAATVTAWEKGAWTPKLPILKEIANHDPLERGQRWLIELTEPRVVTAAKRPPKSPPPEESAGGDERKN